MVKKWIIIVITSVILVFGCVLEDRFVNGAFDGLVERLDVYYDMLDASGDDVNKQENITYIENLHKEFHKKEKILKTLIWHTGLKDIEVSMSRILEYVRENDRTEAMVETNALIDYCKHYSLDFSVTGENILQADWSKKTQK